MLDDISACTIWWLVPPSDQWSTATTPQDCNVCHTLSTRFVVCWSPLPSSLCSECSVGIEEQCGGRCQKGQKGTKKARHTPHSQDATAALNWGRDPYPRKPPAIKTVAVAKPRTRLIVLAGLMVVILSNVPGFQLKPSMPRTLPGL